VDDTVDEHITKEFSISKSMQELYTVRRSKLASGGGGGEHVHVLVFILMDNALNFSVDNLAGRLVCSVIEQIGKPFRL
jgi:hypothetical protein